MKRRDVGIVVLLGAIWGVSFLLIRIAAPVLSPMVLVTIRMLLAGSGLWLFASMTGQPRPAWRASWKGFLGLGLLNSAFPLLLEAVAVVRLNASLVAVLASTTPLFTALVAAVWLRERVTAPKAVGLGLGLVGVGMLVGWSPVPATWATGLGIGAALAAALLYALAALYAKAAVRHTAPLPLAIGQELAAGVALLPWAVAALPAVKLTLPAVTAAVTLALVMTAGGNVLYYYLIAQVGPTKTQAVSFLVPVFALLAGVVVLDEPITVSMVSGFGVTFASVVLVLEVPVRPWAARILERPQLRHDVAEPVMRLLHAARVWSRPAASEHPSYGMLTAGVLYDRHSLLGGRSASLR